MNISRKTLKTSAAVTAISAVSILGLTACGDSTLAPSPSLCAYTIGNGSEGSNRTVDKILLPGDDTSNFSSDKQNAKYFPCGSRNYVVSESSNDADGKVLLSTRTKDNTQVNVSVSVYWMVNQNRDALKQFITFCEKYQCASDNAGSSGSNFATDGWNGMLRENFHSTLQSLAEVAFANIEDLAWKNNDLTQRQTAATTMSDGFATEMRKRTGFTSDLFCGSTSTSKDGKFDCTNVRITVDKVEASNKGLREISDADANAQARIDSTNKLYGPVLGAQVRACQDLGDKCKFVVGPSGAIINVP